MKICVVIPAYNEAKTIANLITEIRQQGLEVLVVDDGSKDNTAEIAKDSKATVLINLFNEGKGASLIKGFDYALAKNFDAVITMDGDGQHLPVEIPCFIKSAETLDAGIIIGNRMHKPQTMPLVRFLTNKFMSWIISLIARQNIPDTQCGFRLIKKEALEKLNLRCRKYEIESEMLVKARRLGIKVESIPIKTIYAGKKSQINPFIDTLRFIRFILTYAFRDIKNLRWITPH